MQKKKLELRNLLKTIIIEKDDDSQKRKGKPE